MEMCITGCGLIDNSIGQPVIYISGNGDYYGIPFIPDIMNDKPELFTAV